MDLSLPFARPYRIRFDEAGADGCVRPSAIVRYLQDLAWHHSEAAGLDRAWYAARNMGWLVRGLELAIVGDAGYGETVTVTTRIAGFRRMWARRLLRGPRGRRVHRGDRVDRLGAAVDRRPPDPHPRRDADARLRVVAVHAHAHRPRRAAAGRR